MSYYYRQVQLGPGAPGPFLRSIIIINIAVFLASLLIGNYIFHGGHFFGWLYSHFGMTPSFFLRYLHLWQPVTYMFIHSHTGILHIFFNMLMLWMFGTEIEQRMGSRRFGIFYFFCGAGAGILSYLFSFVCVAAGMKEAWQVPTVGASGAIYGVMMAFALFFPNRLILLFFIIPIRAFYLMMGLGLMQLYYLVSMPYGGISYIAHVSGMLLAFLFLKYQWPVAGFVEGIAEQRREEKTRQEKTRAEEDQKRIDCILDKINTGGMHTLTKEEKNFLRERSRRRRR